MKHENNPPGPGFRTVHTVRGVGKVVVITAPNGMDFETYRIDPFTSIEMYAGTFQVATQPGSPKLTRVLLAHLKAEKAEKKKRRA